MVLPRAGTPFRPSTAGGCWSRPRSICGLGMRGLIPSFPPRWMSGTTGRTGTPGTGSRAGSAARRAAIWLQDLWAGRESAEFALPLSALALTPGDVIALDAGGRERTLELRATVDTEQRRISARSIDLDVFALAAETPRRPSPP